MKKFFLNKLLNVETLKKALALLKANKLFAAALVVIAMQQCHIVNLNSQMEEQEQQFNQERSAFERMSDATTIDLIDLEQELLKSKKDKDIAITELSKFTAALELEQQKATLRTETEYADIQLDLRKMAEMIIQRAKEKREAGGFLEPGMSYRAVDEYRVKQIDAFPFTISDHRLSALYFFIPNKDVNGEPFQVEGGYKLSLRIVGHLARTILPDGKVSNVLTLFEIDKNRKIMGRLKIEDFKMVVRDVRKGMFHLWAPKVDLSLSLLGMYPYSPKHITSVGFSPMGYGVSPEDLTFRFLRLGLGLGADEKAYLELTPAMVNLNTVLPLISNTYIGVSAIHDLNKRLLVGLTINTTL